MKRKYVILAAVAGFIVALDQLIKMYIHTHYQLGESTPLLPGYFNITYVRNFGAAFGFLGDSHPAFREMFFLAMPPAALIIILLIMRGVAESDKFQLLALSSVFGGAIGNYIDRLRFRYVIDFLDFHILEKYTWPAFNVADMAIVGGVGLLLLLMFREEQNKKKLEARAH
jgi:signal peptidase II